TSEPYDSTTPAGRFMTTIMAGQATLERENIRERSIAGINRLVRDGAWIGGIVPYGYRIEGRKKDARLLICEDALPGTGLTEAGVIRLIYRLSGDEGRSCIWIAERLNALGVPPAYTRDGREVLRGKRKQATSGIWRSGRVRNLLVSPTYRGLHEYGKR